VRHFFFLSAIVLGILVEVTPKLHPIAPLAAGRGQKPRGSEEVQDHYSVARSLRHLARHSAGSRIYVDRPAMLSHAQDLASTQKRRSWFTGADVCRGRKARMVEVIGTIGSCREQHQAVEAIQSGHPDEIMMVAGYCHTSMKPISSLFP
jgi:hypothetical protein